MVIDQETALKIEEEERQKNQILQTRLEKLETVISSLLASQEVNNVH